MAYQTNRGSMSQGSTKNTSAAKGLRKKIFSTGLFAPDREGVKAIGSVQVKEDIVIPAGSYLNLYEADRKAEAHPVFSISVVEGSLKKLA